MHICRSVNQQQEITNGKNDNAQRTIYLSDHALAELNAQRQLLKQYGIISPWVFPDEHGEMLVGFRLWNHWNQYRKEYDISCTLHELRHTFVSMVKNDMPEPLLKATVGHSDAMDTYGQYGHEISGDLKRAADIIDDVFSKIID